LATAGVEPRFDPDRVPQKNSEIFDILPSHNKLPARYLQLGHYLQLTLVGLRRSDWRFFGTLAFSLFL
jgi:hypothetical protein